MPPGCPGARELVVLIFDLTFCAEPEPQTPENVEAVDRWSSLGLVLGTSAELGQLSYLEMIVTQLRVKLVQISYQEVATRELERWFSE